MVAQGATGVGVPTLCAGLFFGSLATVAGCDTSRNAQDDVDVLKALGSFDGFASLVIGGLLSDGDDETEDWDIGSVPQ